MDTMPELEPENSIKSANWESLGDGLERFRTKSGWLYRTITLHGVALAFVPYPPLVQHVTARIPGPYDLPR